MVIGLYLTPIVRAAFGFDAAGTALLALTTQVYLATLAGYAVQETLARGFYARLQATTPLIGIGLRLVLYLVIVFSATKLFPQAGVAAIAAGELAVFGECVFLVLKMKRELNKGLELSRPILRGILAAGVSLGLYFALRQILPMDTLLINLVAMTLSGAVALGVVWKDAAQVLRL